MNPALPSHMLPELSRLVSLHTGLYFPENKWRFLKRGTAAAIRDLNTDIHHLIRCLYGAPSRHIIDALTTHLTVGETYFLRDKNFFQILQDHILRGITRYPKRDEKKIIFWSAACATGEEPYSIAILMDQLFPAIQDWDITIVASDINPNALEKAKTGIYSTWSLRGTPEKIIKTYFTPGPGNYFKLLPRIRNMVRFHQVNLIKGPYSPLLNCNDPIDVVLCCNVLMYFSDADRIRVLRNLSGMIIDNGWLITGPAESGFVSLPEFSPVRFPSALYHRKGPPRYAPEDHPKPPPEAPVKKHPMTPARRIDRFSGARACAEKLNRRITDTTAVLPPGTSRYERYQEAVAAYKQGYYAQAVEHLLPLFNETALSTKTQSSDKAVNNDRPFLMKTESMILLAKAYANLGDLDPAIGWCEQAIAAEKLNPEIYYLLSSILQTARKLDDAIKPLKQAIYLDPEFIMAHFTLGMLQLQNQMIPESRKSMQNAMMLLEMKDPDEVLPFSEGMTAGRLLATLKSMQMN